MLKVVLGITGLAIGGWAGFWIVGLGGEALFNLFHPVRRAPEEGLGIAFAAVFIGVPVGALVGCILGIVCANKFAVRGRKFD
ncbi:MAG: hypothetical protein L0228_08895 [Planctomycetes bacterium]|nr:hypothetical protein [Planctomycetota bacterium]